MQERVEQTWAPHRLLSFLLTIFAGLALALAAIGLYGVVTYTAQRRWREIGLRFALGAQRADIRALVLGHGLRLLAAGLIIGGSGALICARLLRTFLFGVNAFDPAIYLAASALLALAVLIACWLPARRAALVEPIVVLRSE